MCQPDLIEALAGDVPRVRAAEMGEAEADIGQHGEVGKQRVVLEHQAHAAARGRRVAAAPGDAAIAEGDLARVRRVQAGDEPQQRALPAAGGAEHRQDLARTERQRHVVQRQRPAVASAHARHRELPRGGT